MDVDQAVYKKSEGKMSGTGSPSMYEAVVRGL